MKNCFPLVILGIGLLTAGCSNDNNHNDTPDGPCAPWMDTSLQPEARAQALVAAMTLEQKIDQTHGHAPTDDFRVVLGVE